MEEVVCKISGRKGSAYGTFITAYDGVSRNLGEKYLKFYLEQHIEVQLVTLGRGTANDAMLDYFGLESHEKAVLFSVVDDQKWEELSVGLHRGMRIDVPGTGVAFLIRLRASAEEAYLHI